MRKIFEPKLASILREGYTRQTFLADLTAGVIVGIVALPLAIAFAIASGVKPEQGLYTAIIAGFIVSAFGGSRVQIAGPTGAFIVIVYRIVQNYGYEGLVAATLMSGVILIVMGLARFGTLLKFVPYPLTVGFTSGIALIIFSSQINDILGMGIQDLPADFVDKWGSYAEHASSVDLVSLAVGAGALFIIVLAQRTIPRVPGSLIAIMLTTAVVQVFDVQVSTIGSLFGHVPNSLPEPHIPDITFETFRRVFSPAVTIAMLGAIESLLSASVADGMIRQRHRPNIELIAQGVANLVSPLFMGIPATGAIARTATNVKSGGRTPVAGIIHAVTLLLIMLFFGQWAELIPMPTLAAILVVVAYNMSEWRSFVRILSSPKSDSAVMITTFGLTVLVDLTAAIQVGVILSAMLFIRRMAEVSKVASLTQLLRKQEEIEGETPDERTLPPGIEVFEVYGSLFFGAVDQFTETMRELEGRPDVFILETEHLLSIDASGIRAIEDLATQFEKQGTHFLIAGIHKQPLHAMTQSGLIDRIGVGNVLGSLDDAIERGSTLQKGKVVQS